MHTENPFEVSKLCSGTIQADSPFTGPDMFRVEGDVLVCGHPMVLPRICAHGLTRDNLVAKHTLVQFASFRPVLVQRSCSVTYFVNKSSTRSGLVIFAVSIGLIAVAFLLITILHYWKTTFSASQGFLPADRFIAIGTLTILGAFLWWKRDSIRLTLLSYEAPGIYRIHGFSQKYLDAISRHVIDLPTNLPSAHQTNQNH